MVELEAKELSVLVKNLLLYTNLKAVRLREIFFVVLDGKLHGYACDDYIALTDSVPMVGEEVREFAMTVEELEKIDLWLKEGRKAVHKETVKISFFNTYLKLRSEDGDIQKFDFVKPNHEAWDLVFELLSDDNPLRPIDYFAVRGDRFAKMSQLVAEKDTPLIFRGVDVNGHLLLQFKKGSTLSGVSIPIKQEFIQEEFLWKDQISSESTDQSPNLTNTDSVQSNTD